MNTSIHWVCLWLADYYLSATILLAAVLAAGSLLREPVKRISLAWAALAGLALLALLCAAPFWPRLSIVKSAEEPIAAAASKSIPAPAPAAVQPPSLPVRSITTNVDPSSWPIRLDDSLEPAIAHVDHAAGQIDMSVLVAAVFLFGAAMISLWLLVGAIYSWRLCRSATPAPKFVEQALATVAREIFLSPGARAGVRGLPRLLVSPTIHTAAACGLLRPTILLPEDVLSSEPTALNPRVASDAATLTRSPLHPLTPSSASLRALLAHELAHIRRGDLWLLALGRLLLVVLFAHPLYWLFAPTHSGRSRTDCRYHRRQLLRPARLRRKSSALGPPPTR